MATTTKLARAGLQTAKLASTVLGNDTVTRISQGLHQLSNGITPIWTAYTPRKAKPAKPSANAINGKVVYFPACVTRTMGTACNDSDSRDLMIVMNALLAKAGFAAITPAKVDDLCCGMPFTSKGYPDAANQAVQALEAALWQASEAGKYPILCDTSPCTLRMLEQFSKPLKVYETAGFIAEYLLPHLTIQRQETSVALHITCSTRRLGLEAPLRQLAKLCAQQVIEPEEEGCCGFAGDKGFTTPELNAAALQRLKQQLPEACKEGFSNSRTCEIGLSLHSGRQYRSIAYLVERCCS
jgi:D-lactate dehydrogenase